MAPAAKNLTNAFASADTVATKKFTNSKWTGFFVKDSLILLYDQDGSPELGLFVKVKLEFYAKRSMQKKQVAWIIISHILYEKSSYYRSWSCNTAWKFCR